MSKPPVLLALLIAAVLMVDSLILAPVFAIQWRSPEFMADIAPIFNLVKFLAMAVLTAYLWWAVPRRQFRPSLTLALQGVVLLCAVHTLLLLIGRQSLVQDKVRYTSEGPYTVRTVEAKDGRASLQVIYLRCARPLGFYSLRELHQFPLQAGAQLERQNGTWYYMGEKRYELAAGQCD